MRFDSTSGAVFSQEDKILGTVPDHIFNLKHAENASSLSVSPRGHSSRTYWIPDKFILRIDLVSDLTFELCKQWSGYQFRNS